MKPRQLLATALAFALPAWTLCAQDNPPPRPPDAPPRDGGPRPDGPGGQPRPMPGLFGALDPNHDGVIDAEELNQATDVLRKLDRNGDGKLGAGELRPPAAAPSRRPQGDNPRPSAPESRRRPDGDQRDRGPQAEGRGQQRPEPEARGEGARERRPEGRPPGDRREDATPGEGPQRERPSAGRPAGDDRCERPGARPPQAWHRHHHPHRPMGVAESGPRPPWEGRKPQMDRDHDRFAQGSRMDGRPPWGAPRGEGEYRRDAHGPAPQHWHRDGRPSREGQPEDRFDGPRRGPQPEGRGAPRFHREEAPHRAPGPGPRDDFRPPNAPHPEADDRHPPMPPAPRGSGEPRPDHLRHEGPPPQGAENIHPEEPTPV